MCLPCVCQTTPGGADRVFPASRASRGVVSCVALGLPGHPPKGVVPRYPPRGLLRDWSRPVPGSCLPGGRVTPDRGFPPHGGVYAVPRAHPTSWLQLLRRMVRNGWSRPMTARRQFWGGATLGGQQRRVGSLWFSEIIGPPGASRRGPGLGRSTVNREPGTVWQRPSVSEGWFQEETRLARAPAALSALRRP